MARRARCASTTSSRFSRGKQSINTVRILQTIPAALAIAALGLAGCTTGQTQPPLASTGNSPVTTGTIELAVGTANIANAGGATVGLNVVSSFRQTSGQSAALFNTPTLALPAGTVFAKAGVTAVSGTSGATWPAFAPSAAEIAANTIGSSAPANLSIPNQAGSTFAAANFTTLGLFGGVTANGFQQSNSNQQGSLSTFQPGTGTGGSGTTTSTSLVPYPQPFFVAGAVGAAASPVFQPWGGPPAYPGPSGNGTRNGTFETGDAGGFNAFGHEGVRGFGQGITAFAGVSPITGGAYTLSTIVPTGFNNITPTNATVTAPTFTLANAGLVVGVVAAPALVASGNGGATFALILPPNATGAIVQVVDYGSGGTPSAPGSNCYTKDLPTVAGTFQPPAYFTVYVTASGVQTLPANLGPAPPGSTSPTICTAAQNTAALAAASKGGDSFTTQVIAFDYPLTTLTYPQSTAKNPTLVGANGQADISIGLTSAVQTSP